MVTENKLLLSKWKLETAANNMNLVVLNKEFGKEDSSDWSLVKQWILGKPNNREQRYDGEKATEPDGEKATDRILVCATREDEDSDSEGVRRMVNDEEGA